MVETRVTTMVIKVVDLGCEKCHKKIKKILCQIPQIQSQIYVVEKNIVTITVVCCSPEKIKKKILCKGCGFIECVEIMPPASSASASTTASTTASASASSSSSSSSTTTSASSSSAATTTNNTRSQRYDPKHML
ncbi:hypothetical protein OIU78_003802 [Salix suchowensis]|nr:hypothetical protein OIU78_003802 [Salix suchowensis]